MIDFIKNLNIETFIFGYMLLFVITLLINAFFCGMFRHKLTFRDYLDSFLFPVTYIYIIGLTVAGIYNSLYIRYINTKSQIKVIKEREALNKLEKESKNDKS